MPTRAAASDQLHPTTLDVTWTGLLTTDDGAWFDCRDFADRTVQVFGTFGAGGGLTMQGSNEPTPTNPFTLTDQGGTNVALTAAGGRLLAEAPRWVRPLVTGGDGTTSLTVELVARR
jgi:hypothetical protein